MDGFRGIDFGWNREENVRGYDQESPSSLPGKQSPQISFIEGGGIFCIGYKTEDEFDLIYTWRKNGSSIHSEKSSNAE